MLRLIISEPLLLSPEEVVEATKKIHQVIERFPKNLLFCTVDFSVLKKTSGGGIDGLFCTIDLGEHYIEIAFDDSEGKIVASIAHKARNFKDCCVGELPSWETYEEFARDFCRILKAMVGEDLEGLVERDQLVLGLLRQDPALRDAKPWQSTVP